jgi:hypothetical protein
VHHATVVEHEELVLAAAIHARDARADEAVRRGRREASGKARVPDVHGRDAAANDRGAELAHRVFDFRQFRHAAPVG